VQLFQQAQLNQFKIKILSDENGKCLQLNHVFENKVFFIEVKPH